MYNASILLSKRIVSTKYIILHSYSATITALTTKKFGVATPFSMVFSFSIVAARRKASYKYARFTDEVMVG